MEYLIPPWQHQLKAIELASRLPNYALFFEMGAGKTSTAINILRHKFNERKRFLRTLIFCPPIVIDNWKKEWLAHSKVPSAKLVLLKGSQTQRLKIFERAKAEGSFIAITNYEALPVMPDLVAALLAWAPEAVVLDESHKCKSGTSKRTKIVTKIADLAEHRYLLSGTPVLNSPMDLFAQFRILDGGETFGKNFVSFRAEYFYDKNAGMPKQKYFPDWRIRPGSMERMNRKLAASSMRITKEECLDLPPLVRETFELDMLPEQKRVYEDMRKNLVAYLRDKACVAQLALTKALRLMQIASGFAKMDDGSEIHFDKNPKSEALRELLEEITPYHKVLVWAVFKENYQQIRDICEGLKIGYVEIHGDVTEARKLEAVDRLKNDPSVRVLIGHPGSGGIGVNLTSASFSVFFSRNFSLENDLQAEARNHRGGSKEAGHAKITRIDLVTQGTIEPEILKRLANKEQIGESLLHDLVGEI